MCELKRGPGVRGEAKGAPKDLPLTRGVVAVVVGYLRVRVAVVAVAAGGVEAAEVMAEAEVVAGAAAVVEVVEVVEVVVAVVVEVVSSVAETVVAVEVVGGVVERPAPVEISASIGEV